MQRILIVDDSKAMRMIVRRTLRQAGFSEIEIREAEDGRDALASIEEQAPDLVLSDWNMPNMTGIELLTALRGRGSRVRFGFVTTEGSAEMRAQAAAAGALFLIAKPFTPEQFRNSLAEVLS